MSIEIVIGNELCTIKKTDDSSDDLYPVVSSIVLTSEELYEVLVLLEKLIKADLSCKSKP